MKKIIFGSLLALAISTVAANAVDLSEIQKLKEMGFTNEQIVEMTKGNNNSGNAAVQSGVSQEKLNQVNTAKANKKGIISFCVSKEYPDRGPGYLDVFKNNEKIGKIELSGYVSNGPATTSKTNYIEYNKKNKTNSGTSTTTVANSICSRYLGEFELPAGTYEIKMERSFYMGDPTESLRFKSKKHKIFHNVTVEEGKVTMLSYYWEANEDFGKDVVVSGNHKQLAGEVTASWGNNVLKVIEK